MRKCSYLLRIQKVLGVCSCAHVHMHLCKHVCAVFAHVYVWVLICSCTALYLVVCSQGLSVNQELTSGLDCLANELSGSACFCLPSACVLEACLHDCLLQGAGIQTQVLLFAQEAFYSLGHVCVPNVVVVVF